MNTIQFLAHQIRKFRTQQRLSQAELAGKAGVSSSSVHRAENAGGDPTLTTLEGLSKGLGVSMIELLGLKANEDDDEIVAIWRGLSLDKRELLRGMAALMAEKEEREDIVKQIQSEFAYDALFGSGRLAAGVGALLNGGAQEVAVMASEVVSTGVSQEVLEFFNGKGI